MWDQTGENQKLEKSGMRFRHLRDQLCEICEIRHARCKICEIRYEKLEIRKYVRWEMRN